MLFLLFPAVSGDAGSWPRRHAAGTIHAAACAVALLLIPAVLTGTPSVADVELTEILTYQQQGFVAVACRGNSHGCTVFSELKLGCGCSFENGDWRIRWRISGVARMYATNGLTLRHELMHISDVRARLNASATAMEEGRFATLGECDRAADAAAATFKDAVHSVMRSDVQQVDRRPLASDQIVADRPAGRPRQ